MRMVGGTMTSLQPRFVTAMVVILAAMILGGNVCEAFSTGSATMPPPVHRAHHGDDTSSPAAQHLASCESAVVVSGPPSPPPPGPITGALTSATPRLPCPETGHRHSTAPGPAPGPSLFLLHASLLI